MKPNEHLKRVGPSIADIAEQHVSLRTLNETSFDSMVSTLFTHLSNGDICWLITNNEIPTEWTHSGWHQVGDELCESIRRGSKLFYLVPESAQQFENLFAEFLERIRNKGIEPERVQQSVFLKRIGCDQAPPPDSKVAVFAENKNRTLTAVVNTRTDNGWLIYRPAESYRKLMVGIALKASDLF